MIRKASGTACISVLIAVVLAAQVCAASGEKTLLETDSAYYHIRVFDRDGVRYLKCNMHPQSAMRLDDPLHVEYEYVRGMISTITFRETFPEILMVGLGAGTLPAFLSTYYPETAIDIVELDPMIVEVARKYFGFAESPHTRIYVNDGRIHIRKALKKYDIIFLDAYYGDSVPFHLTTREFLELVKQRLKPGGIVVSNLWAPWANQYYDAQAKTYQAVFGELYLLRTAVGNVIFVAAAERGQISRKTILERAGRIMDRKRFTFDLVKFMKEYYSHDTHTRFSAKVLTDDFAPVNILQHRRSD